MFDYETPKEKEPVDYTGLKIAAVTAPVFFLVTYLYNADAGLAACIVLGVIIFAIKLRWHLRKHAWFWAIIAVILALHVPLVFMVQWPKNAPTIFFTMPIGIADFLIISGALKLAENFLPNSSSSNTKRMIRGGPSFRTGAKRVRQPGRFSFDRLGRPYSRS